MKITYDTNKSRNCGIQVFIYSILYSSSLKLFLELTSLHVMSYRQTRSKSFDALQTSLDSDTYSTREALIIGSNERQRKQFNSNDQSHRNLIALARGFLQTLLALVLLVICLWQFSKSQFLNKWEQRAFNMLSILLSAIASLGLGSLLGYLGSMLRWPLLARTMYQMQDV